MGYTHYWKQSKPFTASEWQKIVSEAKRIVAKAKRGLYAGREDTKSQTNVELDEYGVRSGFNEPGAYRIFPHPERPIPIKGKPIPVAGPCGEGKPEFTNDRIALNGVAPEDYESFALERAPKMEGEGNAACAFNFCKTEYRPYDAVVVSILAAARAVAPKKILVTSDGGPEAIKYVF